MTSSTNLDASQSVFSHKSSVESQASPRQSQAHLRTPSLLIGTTVPQTISAFLLPFVGHFRAEGWRVDGMANGISDCLDCTDAFDRVWEVDWSRNPLDPRNMVVGPRAIRQILAQGHYDIVHIHTPVAGFVTRYALRGPRRRNGTSIVYTAHGFHFHPEGGALRNTIFQTLERVGGRWTDHLVVINREDAEAARALRLVPEDRLWQMPGIGVELDYYVADAITDRQVSDLRAELQLAANSPLLLCVAELIPRKRHRDVLLALHKLARNDAHLALAGDGPLRSNLEQYAAELGISDRVHFLGFRRDIPTLMRASVATILASAHEGLPRSVMESMALRTPVIGSQIRGTTELLEDDCGLLFKLGDVDALSACLAQVLDHPAVARRMVKNATDRIAKYDVNNVIEQHEALYNRVLSETSPTGATAAVV